MKHKHHWLCMENHPECPCNTCKRDNRFCCAKKGQPCPVLACEYYQPEKKPEKKQD